MTGEPEDVRDGSASICTQEEFAPIRYHWYPHSGETFAQALRAMLAASGLSEGAQSHVFVEVGGRMRSLARAELRPKRHVKGPVETVRGIAVFEVRSHVLLGEDGDTDVLIRVYHVEPRQLQRPGGSRVVGLHMHLKDVSDPKEIRKLQDAEMQTARDRYFEGRDSWWGVTP